LIIPLIHLYSNVSLNNWKHWGADNSDGVSEPESLDGRQCQKTFALKVINYKEYLPNVMGANEMRKWQLDIDQPLSYKPTINPTTTNVFSTAAFRFGHSEVAFGSQPVTT